MHGDILLRTHPQDFMLDHKRFRHHNLSAYAIGWLSFNFIKYSLITFAKKAVENVVLLVSFDNENLY